MCDSQLKALCTERISNDHNSVQKKFKPGMKIMEAVQQMGKTDTLIIIVHASTIMFQRRP